MLVSLVVCCKPVSDLLLSVSGVLPDWLFLMVFLLFPGWLSFVESDWLLCAGSSPSSSCLAVAVSEGGTVLCECSSVSEGVMGTADVPRIRIWPAVL